MQRKCSACRVEFLPDDLVQRVPPVAQVKRGTKSGLLGIYSTEDTPEEEWDVIHATRKCIELFFSPEEHQVIYDDVVYEIKKDLEPEIRQSWADKFEVVKEMVREKNFNFCIECWTQLEEDELPYCIFCKNTDSVWTQHKEPGSVMYCTRCSRYWDDQDEELPGP